MLTINFILILCTCIYADSNPPFIIPSYPSSYQETLTLLTLLTLQGIVNRNEHNIWMNASSTAPDMTVPVMWVYPDADKTWIPYISNSKNLSFTTFPTNYTICTIINQFKSYINGLMVYNTSLDANAYLSITLSGLYNLLPITINMFNQYQCLKQWTNITYLQHFTNNLAAYDWAIDNLLPLTSTKLVINACKGSSNTYNCGWNDPLAMATIDFGVSRKSFIMNLSPDTVKYPQLAKRFNTILQHLEPIGILSGWAEPEQDMVSQVTTVGAVVLCGAPNLSFLLKDKKNDSNNIISKRLPLNRLITKLDKSKYYIIFQTNEGDTAKNAYSLREGNWLAKQRGSYPIAWGVDPLIAEYFPILWNYYVDTGTKNDTYFSSCDGSGYVYPWSLSQQNQILYFNQTGNLNKQYMCDDFIQIDIWESGLNKTEYEMYLKYSDNTISAFSQQPTIGRNAINTWLDDGTPIFLSEGGDRNTVSLFYPNLNATDPVNDLYHRVMNVANNNKKTPFFILIYGCDNYVEMQFNLSVLLSNQFVMIGAQDMADLGRQAYQNVDEG